MIKRNPIKLNGEGFNRKTQKEREREARRGKGAADIQDEE